MVDSTVQNMTTTTKPSRRRNSRRIERTGSQLMKPMLRVSAKALAKAAAAPSRVTRATTNGGTSVKLNTVSSRPRMR